MTPKRIAMSGLVAAALAGLSCQAASAETPYYAFPPAWPIIALGAVIGDAATALAPHPLLAPVNYGPPYYYLGPPPGSSVYYARAYYPPGYYPPVYAPRAWLWR